MFAFAVPILIVLGIMAAVSAGVALFVIATQDGSRAGQYIGIAIIALALIFAFYLGL
jgi:hypothetical protein